MRPTWVWLLVGLAASAAVSLALWQVGIPAFLLFLVFPFLPFLWRGAQGGGARPAGPGARLRTCPLCGWSTEDAAARFCPRDGGRLHMLTDGLAGNP